MNANIINLSEKLLHIALNRFEHPQSKALISFSKDILGQRSNNNAPKLFAILVADLGVEEILEGATFNGSPFNGRAGLEGLINHLNEDFS